MSDYFAGREDVLFGALRSINIPSSTTVIYGDQGVGKTSLAWQTFEILSDNRAVVEKYDDLPLIEDDHIAFWLECEKDFDNFEGALLSLLLKTAGKKGATLVDKFPSLFETQEFNSKIKSSLQLNAGVAKASVSIENEKNESESVGRAISTLKDKALKESRNLFASALEIVRGNYPEHEIVIFFDEFDRIEDKSGVGDFIKHFGLAKFVFVGISSTAEALISQHGSVQRKILGGEIYLPPLSHDEVNGIFDIAEAIVEENNNYKSLRFDKAYRHSICNDCGGYPAIAQFIGFQSVVLSKALEKSQSENITLGKDSYLSAARSIFDPSSGAKNVFNTSLKNAINKSPVRSEIIVKLSEFDDDWISVDDLESKLSKEALRNIDANIEFMSENHVLKRKDGEQKRIRFETPVLRFLVRISTKLGSMPYYKM